MAAVKAVGRIVSHDEEGVGRNHPGIGVPERESSRGHAEIVARQNGGALKELAIDQETAIGDFKGFAWQASDALRPKLVFRKPRGVQRVGSEYDDVASARGVEPIS